MKKKLQFLWVFLITFTNRHKKFIALGSLAGFFSTLLFLQAYPLYTKLADIKSKKIGVIGRFTENTLPLNIRNEISVGLTSLLPSGEATGSLALFWELDKSEKTYTFHLRSNILWHDGKHFASKDINYKIKGATVSFPDENTWKITIPDAYAPLPTILSTPLIRPGLIGLGAYKISDIQYSGDFISELDLKSLVPDLSDLTYKFYSNADDAVLAFKLGEVNTLLNMPDIADLTTWKKIKVAQTTMFDNYVGIFFNLNNQLFKEKEIRQALTYAIPSFDNYAKAYTPISPLSWAYSAKVRLYRYDPETAAKILEKSDLSTSSGELTVTTFASFIKLGQSIVDAWNKVGVRAKVRIVNAIPPDYQILLLAQPIPPDPDQYQFWQSTQNDTNLTHYNNLKIDKLLEDGRKTTDRDKRIKIYADFQRYLVDDAPVIFLYYPKVYTVERTN